MRSDEFFDKLFEAVKEVEEDGVKERATLLEFKSEEDAFAHLRKVYNLEPGDHVILHSADTGTRNAIFDHRVIDSSIIVLVCWSKEKGLYKATCSPLAIEIPEGLVD